MANRVSTYISYEEGTKSNTAIKYGLHNVPSNEEWAAMQLIGVEVFDKVREHFGKPLYVSSFFRSEALNVKIGGSKTSKHCKGQAIDIDADVFGGVTNKEIFDYIKENLDFDKLIWEFGTDAEPNWVHVSFVSKEKNRNRCLRADKDYKKKTFYVVI
jgi:hypothetical protein